MKREKPSLYQQGMIYAFAATIYGAMWIIGAQGALHVAQWVNDPTTWLIVAIPLAIISGVSYLFSRNPIKTNNAVVALTAITATMVTTMLFLCALRAEMAFAISATAYTLANLFVGYVLRHSIMWRMALPCAVATIEKPATWVGIMALLCTMMMALGQL